MPVTGADGCAARGRLAAAPTHAQIVALSQRAGIVAAHKLRVVIGECAYQLQM